ncbi:MAG: hypothetical protein SFX18_16650 [Pirellulales bacterium]|nr:hypothetical protein [Pirellulales bacterium]
MNTTNLRAVGLIVCLAALSGFCWLAIAADRPDVSAKITKNAANTTSDPATDPAVATDAADSAKPSADSVQLPQGPITFTKHVAPIMYANCVSCHRPGEVGPFSLIEYQDVAKRADFIREITHDRRMPPYHADPNFGDFKNVRRLSEQDLAIIDAWTAAGAPQGDIADLPPLPKFTTGWQLGQPDLILKMPQAFTVPAVSDDIYQVFVIPTGLTQDRTVAAVEFRPGNPKVVHHAILYLDNSGTARRKDDAEPGMGYRSFGGVGFLPTGGLGGWAPGVTPMRLPDGFGKFLSKGSDLALQIHYHPNGKEETDLSEVGIYFTPEPAKRLVTGIALFNPRFNIPAGKKDYEVNYEVTVPCDIHATSIWPHMHLLGREMKVVAKTPDGQTIPMIWVKDWDFNWQDGYEYRQPLKLPKGTKIQLTARYDNSSDNPQNPHKPPRAVHYGEQTTDEMCLCTVQVYPDNPAQLSKLNSLPFSRLGAALGGGTVALTPGEKLRRMLQRYNIQVGDSDD